ncbi:MAG: arsenite methyltransferase [Planctomycetota bacterium]|jgi:SAM-dependent methyltransferase
MTDVRRAVREQYGKIGAAGKSGGSCCTPGCCSGQDARPCAGSTSEHLGYSAQDLAAAPEGADLGLGCGNPGAIAALRPGETVLDLGSGGGFDCFLAARRVGEQGRVIGVDMTPEMVDRARANAAKVDAGNVDFRLGEIEHLPVADASVDVIISNCVINLSPEKTAVFREAFRVLRPGGRLAITDVVATGPLPKEIRESVEMHVGCVAGAVTAEELESALLEAGFEKVSVVPREGSREVIAGWIPGLENHVVSATIEAVRP